MSIPSEKKSLRDYVREYGRYIIPTWLFPFYFIAWGLVVEFLKPKHVLFWFFICVGTVFFGTFIRAQRARFHIPYFKFCFLTMVVPFLIFAAIAVLLAVGQLIFESMFRR